MWLFIWIVINEAIMKDPCPLSLMTNIQQCQSKSPKHVPSLYKKKPASKKSRNCKKTFDRNVPQLMTAVTCLPSTPVPSARCKGQTKAEMSISNQHFRVPKWRAFNFAQVLFLCVLGMLSDSVKKADVYAKSIIFWTKKIVPQLGFELPTSCLNVICFNNCAICALWFAMECCSVSSSSTCCRAQTERRMSWWW